MIKKSRQVAGFFNGADPVSSGIFMLWFTVQLLGFMELGKLHFFGENYA